MPLVKKNGFASPSLVVIVAFSVVLTTAVAIAIYFYIQYQQSQSLLVKSTKEDPQAELLKKVGKLIVLPSNEQPQIATVSDIKRLKGQPFFAHARNGDRVLIYPKAQEAILYDPMANKIVGVGPVAMTQVTPTVIPASNMLPLKVALYNGTPVMGLTTTVTKELSEKLPTVTVVARGDARGDYHKTIVVDLTGKNASQAAIVAKALDGKVVPFPEGEAKPTKAEVLVILGK